MLKWVHQYSFVLCSPSDKCIFRRYFDIYTYTHIHTMINYAAHSLACLGRHIFYYFYMLFQIRQKFFWPFTYICMRVSLYISLYFLWPLLTYTYLCTYVCLKYMYASTYIHVCVRWEIVTSKATWSFYCFVAFTLRWIIFIFSFDYALVYLRYNFK